MTPHARWAGRRTSTTAAVFAAVAVCVLANSQALPAHADPVSTGQTATAGQLAAAPQTAAQARAQATAAVDAVNEAADRVVAAKEALARQQSAVGDAVSASIRAEVEARRDTNARDAIAAGRTQRIRSLYMDAGSAITQTRGYVVLRSLATGDDPAVALRGRDLVRERAVDAVAHHDQQALRAAEDAMRNGATTAEASGADAVAAVSGLRDVAAEMSQLQVALERAQQRVSTLSAQAAQLQAAEEAAAALAVARAAAAALAASAVSNAAVVHARTVPLDYATLYQQAAQTCPGMRSSLLAAVGQVESGHGRTMGPSSAGALGPMQFMPATFAAYAVDGDGDGRTDVMDPADAIFSAAKYLCANGAGQGRSGESGAVFRYNHADWYVNMVQRIADEMDSSAS
ncbi:MAG: lytic murein transglycosylase [Janthinobacterium lividum]